MIIISVLSVDGSIVFLRTELSFAKKRYRTDQDMGRRQQERIEERGF